MDEHQQTVKKKSSDEISAKELILAIQNWIKYLFAKWPLIILFVFIGLSISLYIYKTTPKIYQADYTFALDEGSSGKYSGAGGLALLGISTGSEEAGVFQGKNLMYLYTSRKMLQISLLTPVNKRDSKLFIDWFFEIDSEGKKAVQGKKVSFPIWTDSTNLSPEQNALISLAVGRIRGKYLTISETKNSENFITVSVKSTNEIFSKQYSDIIVSTVNSYYIENKTAKIRHEISLLEQKAALYRGEMNNAMVQTAEAADATPYPNQNLKVLQTNAEKKSVGIKINTQIYSDLIQNLESNKITLAKETPLIQVIDNPVLPLSVIKTPLIMSLLIGAIMGALVGVIILTIRRTYKSIIEN